MSFASDWLIGKEFKLTSLWYSMVCSSVFAISVVVATRDSSYALFLKLAALYGLSMRHGILLIVRTEIAALPWHSGHIIV